MSQPWKVHGAEGPAAELHAGSSALLDPNCDSTRAVRILRATDRAVVLGSVQPASDVDVARAAASGVSVARRRSGGGAVLVGPDLVLWVDVVIPAGDPLWEPDVGRAFWWLGAAWAAALADAGRPGGQVWRGGLVRGPWSSRVCFAGCGAGEVTLGGGAKMVGMAQRRSRTATLFQCAVPIEWDPAPLLDVLALQDGAREAGVAELARCAVGVGAGVAGRLVSALVARLP